MYLRPPHVKVRLLPLGPLCSEIEMLWIAVTLGKVDYNVGYLYRPPTPLLISGPTWTMHLRI